jgi:hypothetical protein
MEEFYALHIDQDHDDIKIPHADVFLNKIAEHKIVYLPNNHIPKALVPLEILFEKNDVFVKVKGSNEEANVIECNLGTKENPKYVKLSSSLSKEQRDEYVKLLKEFSNVFSWKYEYLQTYDTRIIENKIPLKESPIFLSQSPISEYNIHNENIVTIHFPHKRGVPSREKKPSITSIIRSVTL